MDQFRLLHLHYAGSRPRYHAGDQGHFRQESESRAGAGGGLSSALSVEAMRLRSLEHDHNTVAAEIFAHMPCFEMIFDSVTLYDLDRVKSAV